MNANRLELTTSQRVTKPKATDDGVKRIIQKLLRADLMNADAIFKSKEWPCFWLK